MTYLNRGYKRLVTRQDAFGQNVFARALEVEVPRVERSEMRVSPDRTDSGAFVLSAFPFAQIAFAVRSDIDGEKK